MTATSRAVRSLERRVGATLFLRQLLLWLAAWGIALGLATLIARIAFDVPRSSAALGLATLPLAVIGAALHARRLRPSTRQLAALIDAQARCGGLVVASTEVALGEWSETVSAVPRVRWNARREVALATLAAAFTAAVLLVPASAAGTRKPLAIAKDVQRLAERVDMLHDEKILEDAQAEVMTKTLEAVKNDASGDDPAKAWEALDTVDEATMRAAKEAAEAAVQKGQQLTEVEAMAFALGENAAANATEGMKDLAQAAKESEAAAQLDPATKEALGKNALSKEQLQQIASAARAGKDQLRKTMQKLREQGLIDPKTLRAFEKAAEFANRDQLAKFLKENADVKLGSAVGEFCQGKPGRNRGRGDAPMFAGEQSEENGKFREQALPNAAAAALAQSEVVGVSAATPDANAGTRSNGGALANARTDGGSAFTAEVLPRHRGTVQRFFERKK